MSDYHHIPVLLSEVLENLHPQEGDTIIDATLGGAGYSEAILKRIGSRGKLISIDLDNEAIKNAEITINNQKIKNWILAHENFRNIDKIVKFNQLKNISGIVADLGLSSNQLDNSERGISFQKKEYLDMRFNTTNNTKTAEFILNNYTQSQLEKVFREYGEEKFSRQIAKKILMFREKRIEKRDKESQDENFKIKYTDQLFNIIQTALPKPVQHKAKDSARRIFQALRIEVNDELNNLRDFLEKSFNVLAPGGRLAVVSFHSLEDRIVKQFFLKLATGCVCPIDFPKCMCGQMPQGKIINPKPIVASTEEITANSRSQSAKLRVVERLAF